MNKYEDLIDSVINKMKPDEVFTAVCNCNGLTGYANKIKLWIEDIYGVVLTEAD